MSNKIIDTEKKGAGEYLKMLGINFSVAFTVFMLFSMVFGMIFAGEEARAGIMYCWGIAGAMLAAVIMQLVFFTPLVIRRFGYGARIACSASASMPCSRPRPRSSVGSRPTYRARGLPGPSPTS